MIIKMILVCLISFEISFSKGVEVYWLVIVVLIIFIFGVVNVLELVVESMLVMEVVFLIVSYDLLFIYFLGIVGIGEFKVVVCFKLGYKKVVKKSKLKKLMFFWIECN